MRPTPPGYGILGGVGGDGGTTCGFRGVGFECGEEQFKIGEGRCYGGASTDRTAQPGGELGHVPGLTETFVDEENGTVVEAVTYAATYGLEGMGLCCYCYVLPVLCVLCNVLPL